MDGSWRSGSPHLGVLNTDLAPTEDRQMPGLSTSVLERAYISPKCHDRLSYVLVLVSWGTVANVPPVARRFGAGIRLADQSRCSWWHRGDLCYDP